MSADETVMQKIIDKSVRFWIDEDNKKNVYVEFKRYNGSYCLEPFEDEYFRAFLGHKYREMTGKNELPKFNELLEIKRQDTIYMEKNLIKINRRVAGSLRDRIVYFLADDMRRSIIIQSDGWKPSFRTKTKFIKTEADLPQVEPVGGGDCLILLKPYINLPENDFKTEAGFRTIDAPLQLMEKLKQHKADCEKRRKEYGNQYIVSDYVIVHPNGKPIPPGYLSRMFTDLQEKAGLPPCRFHDLRHLCASIMNMQDINIKVAQKRLGHSNITTTMNIYTHPMRSKEAEAAQTIGDFIYNDLYAGIVSENQ